MQSLEPAQVVVGGEFGRRVNRMIEDNILRIDLDGAFLNDFRRRGDGGYWGLGKFLSAVVRLASSSGDRRLLKVKERVINALLETQDPDGYIGTVRDASCRIEAWWDLHESAYLIAGLLADHRFFGHRRSLEAAQRLADFILSWFDANPDLRPSVPPWNFPFSVTSIGLDRALLALSRDTGHAKYQDFVVKFLKLGELEAPLNAGTASAENHAYSHLSHCLAQLDLYAVTGDPKLLRRRDQILDFLINREGLLITGSCSQWECWHDTQSGAENAMETCASAYLAFLMDALLKLEGDSYYGDIMERDVYNALFSATAPDGTRSRYHTPFEGKRFYDALAPRYCCANNNKRFISELGGWIYYRTQKGVALNLYSESTATMELRSGLKLQIRQRTDYPTSGHVIIEIDPSQDAEFEVRLRIPRWCSKAYVSINTGISECVSGGQFHSITRNWSPKDRIELQMPMHWRFIRGRIAQQGRAAILRGPMIFTFNPHRNPDISSTPGFDTRGLKIYPSEISGPIPDGSVRPNGTSCVIQGWPPQRENPFPREPRVGFLLTEYADPHGEGIYFIVPGEGASLLTDDELITPPKSRALEQ